jgi:glycosyltransferase involved in cell wall biosynthesis
MQAIASRLAVEGYSVEVLSSQPSRGLDQKNVKLPPMRVEDDVSVHRLNLPSEVGKPIWRVLNAFHLGFSLIVRALQHRHDIIISTSIPAVLGGFFAAIAAKLTGARLIYYSMDLHPEIGRVSGDFNNNILFQLLQKMDSWTCRQATPVIVHSDDMRTTLRNRPHGTEFEVDVINNFALPSLDDGIHVSPNTLEFEKGSALTVVYAGNFGRFQGLETLVEAMGLISHRSDIELILLGEGVAKTSLVTLKEQLNANIRFIDYQPVAIAKNIIRKCDIGLVMLVPNMYKYAYPSKTMAYLELGCPIIAAVEPESELVQTMTSEGYGFSVPIGNPQALAELLTTLADDTSWRAPMRKAALDAYEKQFSHEVVLSRWSELVRSA